VFFLFFLCRFRRFFLFVRSFVCLLSLFCFLFCFVQILLLPTWLMCAYVCFSMCGCVYGMIPLHFSVLHMVYCVCVSISCGVCVFRVRSLLFFFRLFWLCMLASSRVGEKFLVDGIFFKYAIDLHSIYDEKGCCEGTEFAMKAAGHELRGLNAYLSCGLQLGLSFPMMVGGGCVDPSAKHLQVAEADRVYSEESVLGS
jgi:Clustered mitochondria